MPFGKKAPAMAEARSGDRQPVEIRAMVRLPAGDPVEIRIDVLSTSGFQAEIPLDLKPGMLLRIGLPNGHSPHATVVHTDSASIGCAFMSPLDPAELSLLTGD